TDRGDPDNCGTPSDSCAAARSDERTVPLTVTPVNDAPTASATPASPTLDEDTRATITLAATDPETAAARLQFETTALPAHGTLSKDGTALALGDSFTGSPADVVYQPGPNYNGPDSFQFKSSDGSLDSSATTVSLSVTPVNDAPSASATPASPELAEHGQASITLAGTDAQTAAAELHFEITALPPHGTPPKDGAALGLGEGLTGTPPEVD